MTAPLHHRRCWHTAIKPTPRRMLITAGPTQELLNAARFVGNPLETMDSSGVEALVLTADGSIEATDGVLTKPEFARWLMDRVTRHAKARRASEPSIDEAHTSAA